MGEPRLGLGERTFLKRTVLYVEGNVVREYIYPVPDPASSAREMLQRLAARVRGRGP